MGIITISVDDEVEKRFRQNVKMKLGQRKGALGDAITQALKLWNEKQADMEFTRELLSKQIDRGGYSFSDRGDLHARN